MKKEGKKEEGESTLADAANSGNGGGIRGFGKRLRSKTRVVVIHAAQAAGEAAVLARQKATEAAGSVKAKAAAVDRDALKVQAKEKARAGAKAVSDAAHTKAAEAKAKLKQTDFKAAAKAGARGAAGSAKALAKTLRNADYSPTNVAASAADGVQAARLRAKMLVGEEAPGLQDELREKARAKKEQGRQALLAAAERTAEQRARAKELVLQKKGALEEELRVKQAELSSKVNTKLYDMSQKHAFVGAALGGLGRAGRGLKKLGLRKLGLAELAEKPDRRAVEAGWIVNGVWRGRRRALPPIRCPVLDARAAAGELLHAAARAGDVWHLQRLLRELAEANKAGAAGSVARPRVAALPDMLTVRVLRANGLLPMDRVTKLVDAFVRLEVAGQSFRTPARLQTVDPVWAEEEKEVGGLVGQTEKGKGQAPSSDAAPEAARSSFEFRVTDPDAVLRCCVYHEDPVAHEAIGSFEVALRSLLPVTPNDNGAGDEGGAARGGGTTAPLQPTTAWYSLAKVRPDVGELPTLQPGKHLGEPVGAPGWVMAPDDDGAVPASVLAGMEAGRLAQNGGGRGRVQLEMRWRASCEGVLPGGGADDGRGRGEQHWVREGLDARQDRRGLGIRTMSRWDVDDAEADGATLLHTAATAGRIDVVRLLCEDYGFGGSESAAGALSCAEKGSSCATEAEGKRDESEQARSMGPVAAAAPGEERGRGRFRSMGRFSRLEARDASGATALFRAAAANHLPVVRYLHESQGAALEAATHWGETALHRASELAHARVVHYLLSSGAWVAAADTDGLASADVVGRSARPLWLPNVARRKLVSIEAVHAMLEARAFVESVAEEVLLDTLTPEEAALARAEADEARGGRARSRSLVINHEEDVAAGKTATASTNLLDEDGRMHPASHALDGDPASYWSTKENCNRASWEVDLKAAHRICRVVIRWRPNKRGFGGDLLFFPRRFTVQASLDTHTWENVHTQMEGNGEEAIAIERPFTARYVRIDISLAAQRTRPTMGICAVQLFQQVAKTKEATRFEALLSANPDAHAARFAFAQHLFSHQNHAAAVQQTLELLERTVNKGSAHEDSARALLDQIFFAIGDADDVVIHAKRCLAELDMKHAMHEDDDDG